MRKANDTVIKNAFKRLQANEKSVVIDGMKALLDSAVVYALRIHEEDPILHNHLETGDSYGWALGFNGQCVAVKVTIGENYADKAESVRDTLVSMASDTTSKNKYVGIVMAGMNPASFYNVVMEEKVLSQTMDWVAGDFDRYFHKL